MNKQAIFDTLTPAQMAVLSALVGAGAFSVGRIGHQAINAMTGPDKQDKQEIQLDVPVAAPGIKQAEDGFNDDLKRVLLGFGMLPAGFLGAKGLYDHLQAQRSKDQIEQERQKYLQTLSGMGAFKQAEEKKDAPTPITDAFLAKYAEEIEKTGEGLAFENMPFEVQREAMDGALKSGIGQRASSFLSGGLSDKAVSAGQMLAAMTALLSGGALVLADRKKAKAEEKREYPNSVSLNPVSIPAPAQQPAVPQPALG